MAKDLNKIYTREDILSELRRMNAPTDSIVLMHSSLRLIGKVEGGVDALLDTLIEYFTSGGGLFCIPTHTWKNLKNDITLDMNDPSTSLGALSDIAAADKRGLRSENPTHSMVVYGDREKAADFIKNEPFISSGTAADSCYGKLYSLGGYVLLVGVAHNRNTYLHAVEELIGTPNRLSAEPREVKVKRITGEIVSRTTRTHFTDFTGDVSLRFPKYETAFRYHGAIIDGYIGNAPTQLCDARIMKDVMELIQKNSDGKDPLADERDIPPRLYR